VNFSMDHSGRKKEDVCGRGERLNPFETAVGRK
jgi:hypothetical protein